jgi:hypothetical protein
MADVSWNSAPPASPAPSRTAGDQAGDDDFRTTFQQALRDADSQADDAVADRRPDPDRVSDHGDDDQDHEETPGDDRKKRKGLGERRGVGLLTGRLGLPAGAMRAFTAVGPRPASGAPSGLGQPDNSFAMMVTPSAENATRLDLGEFAELLEKFAANAGPTASQSFQILLGDAQTPLTGVGMTRLADGSLAITLGTDSQAVAEVRSALESLRRRLQARGLSIGELTVDAAFAPPTQSAEAS